MKTQQGSGLTSMRWVDLLVLQQQGKNEGSLPHLLHLVAVHHDRAADPVHAATLGCLSWTGSVCPDPGLLHHIFVVAVILLAGSSGIIQM